MKTVIQRIRTGPVWGYTQSLYLTQPAIVHNQRGCGLCQNPTLIVRNLTTEYRTGILQGQQTSFNRAGQVCLSTVLRKLALQWKQSRTTNPVWSITQKSGLAHIKERRTRDRYIIWRCGVMMHQAKVEWKDKLPTFCSDQVSRLNLHLPLILIEVRNKTEPPPRYILMHNTLCSHTAVVKNHLYFHIIHFFLYDFIHVKIWKQICA